MAYRTLTRLAVLVLTALLATACASTRHVPEGSYLLDNVSIDLTDKPRDVSSSQLYNYLRQQPNHKVLGFAKLQLAFYNMSGSDSTKRANRWVRRLGQPPVIFSPELTDASARQLRQALVNRGYMNASVEVDTILRSDRRKADVKYSIRAGEPHRVRNMSYEIADSAVADIVMADSAHFTLRSGSPLDLDLLDNERARIALQLRNNGFYAFTKDYITFLADTAAGSYDVDLTLVVNPPRPASALPSAHPAETVTVEEKVEIVEESTHQQFTVGKVYFITDYTPGRTPTPEEAARRDTVVTPSGIAIVYGPDRYIRPEALERQCFIMPGEQYNAAEVDRTYESLSRLSLLRSINIDVRPVGPSTVDAYIMLTRNRKQGISVELEGTNSEGDLGLGVGLGYRYRNLGKESNMLTAKLRMNYESLSGNFSGLINNRYTEFAGEVGITMPQFLFPFLSPAWRRRVKASTETTVSFNYQERPEYTRIIAGAAYKYRWTTRSGRERRTLDLVDINYVRLPESTIDFINTIAPSNPLLRYAYEDHLIMRTGYTYYLTNRRVPSGAIKIPTRQAKIFTIRASAELAGNILYLLSSLSGARRYYGADSIAGIEEGKGVYRILGIPFSQYAKTEFDYTLTRNFPGTRHSVAFHVAAGVAVPYGNSRMVPFEKRFYAGGANGVRGWNVRTLGPGSYAGRNSVANFINQCGDISLNLSFEYRAKLFWVFDGALFVDAGNIWTIHNYSNQPGGMFHLGDVPRQLAASYGTGLRLDFDYFLLRFDLGLKAHNPAEGEQQWPLLHPRWKRDATFHFAVGLPF